APGPPIGTVVPPARTLPIPPPRGCPAAGRPGGRDCPVGGNPPRGGGGPAPPVTDEISGDGTADAAAIRGGAADPGRDRSPVAVDGAAPRPGGGQPSPGPAGRRRGPHPAARWRTRGAGGGDRLLAGGDPQLAFIPCDVGRA